MIVEFKVSETKSGVFRITKKDGEPVVTYFVSQPEMDCLISKWIKNGNYQM